MNLRSMSVYCKVVEKGVMAHAADDLEMTPAAVTKVIADLEANLGLRLMNRTTRKMVLTEAGRQYYEACVSVLSQVSELHQQFSTYTSEVKGKLRIVAPLSYGVTQMSEVLCAFSKAYPNVELLVHLDDKTNDIIEEGFDIAIRIKAELRDSSLIAKPFGKFKVHLLCSKNYLKTHGPIKTPDQLKGHRCLAYSNALSPNRWTIRTKNSGNIVHVFKPYMESNNSLLLKELLLNDKGICSMPAFLAEEELKSGKLVSILDNYSLGEVTGYIVYPSKKFNPPTVTKFVEFFVNWHSQK